MITINIRTLLLVLIAIVLVIILILLFNISAKLSKLNKKAAKEKKATAQFNISREINSPISDFFLRSMDYVEKVVTGQSVIHDEDARNSDIVHRFRLLNPQERQHVINTINYYQSDPLILSSIEKEFRNISIQEKLPLYLVILKSAMQKNNINSLSNAALVDKSLLRVA